MSDQEEALLLQVLRVIRDRTNLACNMPALDKRTPGISGMDARLIAREVIALVREADKMSASHYEYRNED